MNAAPSAKAPRHYDSVSIFSGNDAGRGIDLALTENTFRVVDPEQINSLNPPVKPVKGLWRIRWASSRLVQG